MAPRVKTACGSSCTVLLALIETLPLDRSEAWLPGAHEFVCVVDFSSVSVGLTQYSIARLPRWCSGKEFKLLRESMRRGLFPAGRGLRLSRKAVTYLKIFRPRKPSGEGRQATVREIAKNQT